MRSFRPSRQEREPFITAINIALADGRIDAEEHSTRVGRAETAISFAELDTLVSDIPFEWHDEKLAAAKRATRRQIIVGAAGLLVLSGLSWFGTRRWIDRVSAGEVGASTPVPSTTPEEPSSPHATSETLPTTLVEVDNWQTNTMKTAMDFAESEGIDTVNDVYAGGETFTVSGATKDRKARTVTFRHGSRPEVEGEGSSVEGYPTSKLASLDMKDLLAKSRKVADLGDDPDDVTLRIRYWPQLWTINIRGNDTDVYWRIDGRRQWDEETEWDATS